MKFSSLHTHTLFCDGSDGVEAMCRAAFDKGLLSVGFSAHGPLYKKTGIKTDWHLGEERLPDYINEVRAARLRWEGKLKVFLGLELDYIKGRCSALDRDIRALELDYIIGSVHYIVPDNGAPPFTVDGPADELEEGIKNGFGGDGQAMMHAYWDALAEMIALGGFDILGHADLVKKNNGDNSRFDMGGAGWLERQAEIAGAVCKNGCVVELNTGGLNRNKTRDTYPSLEFLRMLKKNNTPILVTADAHRAEDIDGNYETARLVLLHAGYSEHVLFEGRVSGGPLWRTEGIGA